MQHKFNIEDDVRVKDTKKGATIISCFLDNDCYPAYVVEYIGVNSKIDLFREYQLELR